MSTITTINATDEISDSRSVINTNFANLNSGKVETSTTVNGHALSGNVAVTAADVGAPSGSGNSTGTNTGDQTNIPGNAATVTGLSVVSGKTLEVDNSLELAGTDSTKMTFPGTSATIARTDAAQTFTGIQTFSQIVTTNNAITASGNAATVPITSRISTVMNNSAATLTITITTTSAVDGQMIIVRVLDFSAVAETITWVNTENSTVSVPTTSNGSTTLPLTVGFQFNANTSKWRCIGSA